ncbi:MAG: peptide chain release factor N(5)-glutamine methyltransferase [bacterium]
MLKPTKTWPVLELLNWTTEYLSKKGFENSKLNAERLLSHSLNFHRVDLYLNFDRPLSPEELKRFKKFLKRRLRREPLQYILGETEFMSLLFKVNPSVLIPRPETEILVDTVLNKSKEQFQNKSTLSILDIGTGSGCIAVSLAKYLKKARITALDVSDGALETAAENAHLNEVENKIHFFKENFLDSQFSKNLSQKFDVVVSNPPYVSAEDFVKLPEEVKYFEPTIALQDGKDGLTFYYKIAEFSLKSLNPVGFVAVEVSMGQASQVKEIFLNHQFSKITFFKDLNGNDRVIVCEY